MEEQKIPIPEEVKAQQELDLTVPPIPLDEAKEEVKLPAKVEKLVESLVEQLAERERQGKELTGKEIIIHAGKKVIIVEPETDGLSNSDIAFINEYMKNGFNGMKAYHKVHPTVTEESARALAPKLLAKVSVKNEIRSRLEAGKITESWVLQNLMEIGMLRDSFRINAATTALATIAKSMGMLTETKKPVFSDNNPAVFLPVYTAEEKAKFDQFRDQMGRITE